MKKIMMFAAILCSAVVYVSCGNGGGGSLKNDVDTLSYAIGLANGGQMKGYMHSRGIDTTEVNEFLKGFEEGVNAAGNSKKDAYYLGLETGRQMAEGIQKGIFADDSTETLSREQLMAGLRDGVNSNYKTFTIEQAMGLIEPLAKTVNTRVSEKKYKDIKEAGEKFLAENGKKAGVKTLPSGVQYKVITEGKGELPTDSSVVKINYEGKTIDGNVFDSSYKRGQPIEQNARGFIPGFTEALVHMPVGSTWEVYIPWDKAYGAQGNPSIKPFSTLIFKIELISTSAAPKAVKAPQAPVRVLPAQAAQPAK